jgi:hypothetical protein
MSLISLPTEQHPQDMLHAASAVLSFLHEGIKESLELTNHGGYGLSLILQAVQQEVDRAAELVV